MRVRIRRHRGGWFARCTCGDGCTFHTDLDGWHCAMAWATGHIHYWHQRREHP